MTADLSALIARLEAAEVGSRELDVAIARSLGWGIHNARRFGLWVVPFGEYDTCDPDDMFELGAFTTSLDAALALAERVLPDREIALSQRKPRHLETCAEWWHASLFKVRTGVVFGVGPSTVTAKAATPALALCIAILRAKQGEGE